MCLLVSELCGYAGGTRAGPSELREAQGGRYPVMVGPDGSSAPETTHKGRRRTTSDEGSALQDLRTLTSRTPDFTNLKILTALTTYSCLLS